MHAFIYSYAHLPWHTSFFNTDGLGVGKGKQVGGITFLPSRDNSIFYFDVVRLVTQSSQHCLKRF